MPNHHRYTAEDYRLARGRLIAEMGGKCVPCDERGIETTDNLTFGHPNGRNWEPNRKNRMQRLRLYRRDWLAGECRLECAGCNLSANGYATNHKKASRRRRGEPRRKARPPAL